METRFPIPDIVFLLDLDPFTAIHRISNSRNDIPNEFERVESLTHVRQVFNSLLGPIKKVDGGMSIDSVHHEILRAFVFGPMRAKRCAKEYGCDDPQHCTFALSGTCNWWNESRKLLANLPASA